MNRTHPRPAIGRRSVAPCASEIPMRSAAIFTALLALTASAPAAAGAFDFFPLEEGNLWVYETPAGHHVVRVSTGESLGGGWYASDADGLLSGSTWIYDNTDDDGMYSYSQSWSALFDFGASVGDSWAYDAGSCDTFDVEVGDASAATTPAGNFTGITEFILTHSPDPAASCVSPPVSRIRFAEGIGPVHFTDSQAGSGRLIYARVGDTVEAMAPGSTESVGDLELSMVLTNNRPSAADTVGVLVVLTNTSDSSQTITLPTGQPFVIDIFERFETTPAGSWSGGTGGDLTLAAGASHVLFGEISVGSDWSGIYTFEGSLGSDATSPHDLPALSVDINVQ
ncbi:MAG: hypothetical protein ACI8RZ_000702 [Myxococcota bacterium]|jgi:hypothetical protein